MVRGEQAGERTMVPSKKSLEIRDSRDREYNFSNDRSGLGSPATSEYTLEIGVCHRVAWEIPGVRSIRSLFNQEVKPLCRGPKVFGALGTTISAMSTVASTIMAAERNDLSLAIIAAGTRCCCWWW